MTFEQAFDKIKEKFAKADASGVADFALQITLTDEDCGGTLYAAVKDGVLSVEPYDYRDNTAALNITKSALLAVLSGRSGFEKAVNDGAAVINGDASNIASLKATIKKAPAAKKTAAKKTTAKKPAAKKTAAKKPAAKKTAEKKAPAKKAPAKTAAKTEAKPAAKTEVKPAAKTEVKPAVKAEAPAKTAAKKTTK